MALIDWENSGMSEPDSDVERMHTHFPDLYAQCKDMPLNAAL
jgi:aminoglycoside phosphotransferase (APT) family kinase protein